MLDGKVPYLTVRKNVMLRSTRLALHPVPYPVHILQTRLDYKVCKQAHAGLHVGRYLSSLKPTHHVSVVSNEAAPP